MIDLNSKNAVSDRINWFIDQAIDAQTEVGRKYLGASIAGAKCQREVQYHLLMAMGAPISKRSVKARIKRIFDRGNLYEDRAIKWLQNAGFVFDGLQSEISDFNGMFRGHNDGVIVGGPDVGVAYPCLWECKCLGSKGFKAIEKDGLKSYSSTYWAQIHLYMAYLDLDSCIFTVVNADTMDLQHLYIPRDFNVARSVRDSVEHIFSAVHMGEMVPRISTDPNYFECKSFCDFYQECWGN